jgi:hypothetical protein
MTPWYKPPPSPRKRDDRRPCCTKENLHEWDCGCSNGCNACYLGYECRVCLTTIDARVDVNKPPTGRP